MPEMLLLLGTLLLQKLNPNIPQKYIPKVQIKDSL